MQSLIIMFSKRKTAKEKVFYRILHRQIARFFFHSREKINCLPTTNKTPATASGKIKKIEKLKKQLLGNSFYHRPVVIYEL